MAGLWRNNEETPEGKYPIVLRRDGSVLTKPYFVLVDCDPGFVAAMRAYAMKHIDLGNAGEFTDQILDWCRYVEENPPPPGDPTAPPHRKDDPAILAWARSAHSKSA